MTEEEIGNLYIRIAFQYESAIGRLFDKKIIDQDLVDRHRKAFYDSLDEEKYGHLKKIETILKSYAAICEAWPVRTWSH